MTEKPSEQEIKLRGLIVGKMQEINKDLQDDGIPVKVIAVLNTDESNLKEVHKEMMFNYKHTIEQMNFMSKSFELPIYLIHHKGWQDDVKSLVQNHFRENPEDNNLYKFS